MVVHQYTKWRRKLKAYFKEVWELKTSPHEIALGFGVGTFIEILPTFFGINLILASIIAFTYKRISKIALLAALVFWNPFFLIPLYNIAYKIGNFIYKDSEVIQYSFSWAAPMQILLSRRFIVGLLILACCLSVVSYIIVRVIATRVKSKK